MKNEIQSTGFGSDVAVINNIHFQFNAGRVLTRLHVFHGSPSSRDWTGDDNRIGVGSLLDMQVVVDRITGIPGSYENFPVVHKDM